MTKRRPTGSGSESERSELPLTGTKLWRDDVDLADLNSAPCQRNRADPQQTAAYIADMLEEIQAMAEKADHKFLAYLLDVALEEAMMLRERKM